MNKRDAEDGLTPLDRLIDALVGLVEVPIPALPSPLSDYFDHDPATESERGTLDHQAGRAMHRLVALGARTEDLYAVARWTVANAIFDTLVILDEGPEQSAPPPWRVVAVAEDGQTLGAPLTELHAAYWPVVDDIGRDQG
jgi:hypothetical protein